MPTLDGRYIYADFCQGRIRSFALAPKVGADDATSGIRLGRIASFAEDEDGRIYVLSLNGEVARLVEAP